MQRALTTRWNENGKNAEMSLVSGALHISSIQKSRKKLIRLEVEKKSSFKAFRSFRNCHLLSYVSPSLHVPLFSCLPVSLT